MNDPIKELISLLGINQDDVLRAVLSVYSPCQPGVIKQSWSNRKNYGPAPDPEVIWSIFVAYDFRCMMCGSQYRISLDHIDDDTFNGHPSNLRVLCQQCNRGKQLRGTKEKDKTLRIYKAFAAMRRSGRIMENVSQRMIADKAGVSDTGGNALYLLKFLFHRHKSGCSPKVMRKSFKNKPEPIVI